VYTFKEVILAEPDTMKEIVSKIGKVDSENCLMCMHLINTVYKDFSSITENRFDKVNYKAVNMVDKIGIDVCPYCNRSYINTTKVVKEKKNGVNKEVVKRTAQLDHFYSKSKYSYLSMSYYNLIPSCPTCNTIKGEQQLNVNPYTITNSNENIVFDYINKIGKLSERHISWKPIPKEYEEDWKKLGLEVLYKKHDKYLQDLLIRMEIYNSKYRQDLYKFIYDEDKEVATEFDRAIIGNYYEEKDLSKQPLSKLTKDIFDNYFK
jgi:hypothetical protein